jgi:hypothetical protein
MTNTSKAMFAGPFGRSGVLDTVVYCLSEPELGMGALQYLALPVATMPSTFPGMQLDSWGDAHSRGLEWRIPWGEIPRRSPPSRPPPPSVVPATMARYGLSFGYEDTDSVGQPDSLVAWIGGTPFTDAFATPTHWGDIEFGPGFPPVATPVESLLAVVPHRSRVDAALKGSQAWLYYTLSGRRASPSHMSADHGPESREGHGSQSRGVLVGMVARQPRSRTLVLGW